MVEEFYTLYNTLSSYKKSIVKNLDKIDEYLLQEFGDYGESPSRAMLAKKYSISKDMLGVLQTYIKILFLSESAVEVLITKLDCDRAPDRDESRRNSNPFHLAPFVSTPKTPEPIFIKTEMEPEKFISNFNDRESDLISDTETIVGVIDHNFGDVEVLKECVVESTLFSPIVTRDLEIEEPIIVTHDLEVEKPIIVTRDLEVVERPIEPLEEVEVVIKNFKLEEEDILEMKIEEQSTLEETSVEIGESILEKTSMKIEEQSILEATSVEIEEKSVWEKTFVKIEEQTTLEMTPVKELIPNMDVETKIKRVSALETQKPETQPPSEPKYTSLVKLLNMTVHDRRKEAEKRYATKHVHKEFKWRTISRTPSSPEKRIKVSKYATFDIKNDVLDFNQYCIFSHVETPREFYVRTNQELFESLESSLNEDLNNQFQYVIANYKSKQEARATVGNFCFVFLANRRKWYRVQVIDWMETEKEQILVQLIDYGEKFICRYENLKRMMELYSEFPKMAIKCHLAALESPDSRDKDRWPQGSIHALIELSAMKEKSKFLTIHVHKEGDSYGVDLKRDDSDKSLAEILIENELAVQEKIDITIFEEEEEDLEDYNINEIVCGYDAQDEARICPFSDNLGKCFKGPSCKLEHSRLSADGVTTDKALIITQALTELLLPSGNQYIEILITGYINTCHFYAQIIKDRNGSSLYNDDFNRLIENMNSNNIVQTYEPFKINPGISEVISVKHGRWYRATCVEHLPDNQFKVFMVDFGIYLIKKITEIRQIQDDFLYLPFQAVECMLDSCCEKIGVSLTHSKEFYETCMQLKPFKAYVVNASRPLRLKLYDEKNLDMDYVLKECGLGQDRDNNSFPDRDCFVQLN